MIEGSEFVAEIEKKRKFDSGWFEFHMDKS